MSPDADFGVRVAGDSMEPLYLDGQIIWIHKQETLEEGEIGVFFLEGTLPSPVPKMRRSQKKYCSFLLNRVIIRPHLQTRG